MLFSLIGQRYRKKNEATGLGFIGIGMLLMLGSGLYMLNLHELEAWEWKAGLLAACSLFWIAFGIGARVPLLHLAVGLLLFLFMLGYFE